MPFADGGAARRLQEACHNSKAGKSAINSFEAAVRAIPVVV
jgi:hypothetical protein